ncbi:putative defense protein 3 [Harpegnathos saltator]|uniref:Putative ferric-chelate reductase 1 n=1 Tax=Harpegnathos saltator TaxID=610380 RepID=E2BFQ3_HARSA|nr:putative defense protein 3 [Harpegnathos saltator]EFN85441.1 Putative ferric-chelate reductase 1 [Harpegnathos saltator]
MRLLIRHIAILLALVVVSSISVLGFPDGAPVDTCVKPRPNQPYHGEARSQPLNTSPYKIVASSSRYEPGSQITVTIVGGAFKGFFLQARDSKTNEWTGSWAQTPNTNTHPECSAVTHADPRDKEQATFLWNAPPNARGSVYFTGTVLKDYATFWSDLTSQAVQ